MGKEKKELHPADKERRKHKKRDLKKNAGLRKTHRETILGAKSPDEILSEIHKLNRTIQQGLGDDKSEIRKKQLVDAHKSAMRKLNESKQAKPKEEAPQVVIKGMNKIFRTKAAEGKKEDELLALENKMEPEEEEEGKGEEGAGEYHERKDRSYARFSEDDLSAMTFDDLMVGPTDEDEGSLLEAPPGIVRPPGVRGRRQRNYRASNRQISTPSPLFPTPTHFQQPPPPPPQQQQQQRAPRVERVRRAMPIDPLDIEAGLKQQQQQGGGGEQQQEQQEGVEQEMFVGEEEEEEGGEQKAIVATPINKSAIISAAPQRPAIPPVNPASIAFIPTSLLIKNRNNNAAEVKRPPAAAAATKKPDKKASKRGQKAAAASSAYDEFMKGIDALGGEEE